MTVTVMAMFRERPDQPAAIAEYWTAAALLMDAAGARIAQRFDVEDVVIGDQPPQTVMLVNYPDTAAVDRVFKSDAYAALRPIRDTAFSQYAICLIGEA